MGQIIFLTRRPHTYQRRAAYTVSDLRLAICFVGSINALIGGEVRYAEFEEGI